MDAIKILDQKLKAKNSYYALGCKVCKYSGIFMSFSSILINSTSNNDHLLFTFYTILFLHFAINMHISPYLYIKNEKYTISFFSLLRDTPIQRKTFIQSRLSILYKFVIKFTIVYILIEILSIICLDDNFSCKSLFTSLFCIALEITTVTVINIITIYRITKKD